MTLNFPSSPSNGDLYENYIYNSTAGAWQLVSIDNIYTGASISGSPPASPESGDMWWDSDDGKLYIYYNDGTSSQWVNAAGPSVAVQDTAPTGYEGQLWLDSTDGSMYTYYTDPGGGSSSWIGAVSRSGGILQVVSTTKTDTFSTTSTSFTDVTGLSATITPRSTSSKVLALAKIGIGMNNQYFRFNLLRNSTAIAQPDAGTFPASGIMEFGSLITNVVSFDFLDSPSTTSSTTYKIQAAVNAGTGYVNRDTSGNRTVVSTLTLIEVAG